MQNWDSLQGTANYMDHNNWYNNMFAANIKTEPGTLSATTEMQQQPLNSTTASSNAHLEKYVKQQQFSPMDTNMTVMSPPPSNSHHHAGSNNEQQQQFFDTAGMHQQFIQQQQFQQQFQQAQQAAAQNQVTSHLPLGFNPLTPPGLPQAILPAMSQFYAQSTQQKFNQQTPSPQSLLENSNESTLTPLHTPPMDITPPKSPKTASTTTNSNDHAQSQELLPNPNEDPKCFVESDEDENIRLPIYNSHGKMKNYKCKSCGMVAITKIAFWEHAETHMKPEKILKCPKCPFVTELKHHLEYHIRKHKNLKPFQCDKCSYSCVNKSMLNSHRKSHSSVYQYRCSDCDYATKYCHSFKLHLRKYDHKPGLVLDEDGLPNPSVIIDVYGTRRGPKNRSARPSSKKSKAHFKQSHLTTPSQLTPAPQGFTCNTKNQRATSPARSISSVAAELPALTVNMTLQQQQSAASQISPTHSSQISSQNSNISNLLPPLATLLQQNNNMSLLPYWKLNLQMLAAQQQAVLAQLSPSVREQIQNQLQNEIGEKQNLKGLYASHEDDDEEEESDCKSVDSAMDLSQGPSPKNVEEETPETPINLKLPEDNIETPILSSSTAARRKGRILKLDQEQIKPNQSNSDATSSQTASQSKIPAAVAVPTNKTDHHNAPDESMETGQNSHNSHNNQSTASPTTTPSSSGNSSNLSSTAPSSGTPTANPSPAITPIMYECKYCDIYFKDTVLYTIHMGYHSCDDVFKCNMCGEKCEGPVGLFVHMARNAHS